MVEVRNLEDDAPGLLFNDNSASMLMIWSAMMVICGHVDEINIKQENPRDKVVKLFDFWHDWYECPVRSFLLDFSRENMKLNTGDGFKRSSLQLDIHWKAQEHNWWS